MDEKKQEAYTEVRDALRDEIVSMKELTKDEQLSSYQIGFLDGLQQAINILMPIAFTDAMKGDTVSK